MTPDRWNRIKQIFNAALDRDEDERGRWLASECAGDEALCEEVASLLAAADGCPYFIDTPVMERALGAAAAPTLTPSMNWIGRTLGHYRIIEEIGHGGMSAVFRAARIEDHFEHEVAIKLLKQSHDTQRLLRRFRAERQILARLSHPNIAHLLDGGSSEEGLPYLVMEYVRGEPIDAYCERRGLDIGARLRLFRTLCEAVHYVHRHLMVHGDLKCGNVLVNEDGIVKLLDFGIARLLDSHPALAATHQKFTAVIALTPEYASPEQIRGLPVTTASDIYSLGVLLFKLLTRQLPYKASSGAYYDLATQICNEEPPRPSAVVVESAIAAQLRGDLDNVVLKALQKDPDSRYTSVEQFAQDITRHLAGFPVAAMAESTPYRIRKFIGRNRALVAAGLLVAVSLVTGIVATSWQAHVATRERERAERHFNDVRALAQTFMVDVHDSMATLPGSTSARRQIIAHSLKYLDSLANENRDDIAVQLDLARAYDRVGDLQDGFQGANLADTEAALRSYLRALEIRNAVWRAGHQTHELQRERLRTYHILAQVSQSNRALDDAREYARQGLEIASALAQRRDASVEDQRLLANAYAVEGTIEAMANDVGRGLRQLRKAIAIYARYVDTGENTPVMQRSLAIAYGRLADLLAFNTDRADEAMDAYGHSLDAINAVLKADPRNTEMRKVSSHILRGAAQTLSWQKRHEEALEKRRRAVEIIRELDATETGSERYRLDLGGALSDFGESLHDTQDLDRAKARLEEADTLLRGHTGAMASRLNMTQYFVAINDLRLALVLADLARRSQRREALALWERARMRFQGSAKVLAAAKDDPVLAGREAARKHLEAETGLRECDARLAAARG